MATRSAAVSCALCVPVLPTPSVNPTARSEGLVPASAQQDQMMKTLAPAMPPVLAAEAQWQAQRSVHSRSDWTCARSLVSQCLFQSHSTCFCVRPKLTQPLQPSVRTKLRHVGRQVHTSMSRWALVLLRHNRRFQVIRHAVPRKSSHFLQFTDHESLFKWHAVQRLANRDTMAPSLIQIANRHAVHLYITLSPKGNTWLVCAFPKTRTNAVLPSFFT